MKFNERIAWKIKFKPIFITYNGGFRKMYEYRVSNIRDNTENVVGIKIPVIEILQHINELTIIYE